MLTVFVLPRIGEMPSASPFCVKLVVWLNMMGIEHTSKLGAQGKAPKGKFPFVDLDGEIIGDSGIIIDRLTDGAGAGLDDHLTTDQLHTSHLLRRTLEESFYFTLVAHRWQDDAGFATLGPVFQKLLPPVVRSIAPGFIRSGVIKQLKAQGTGRHNEAERAALGLADLRAIEGVLGDKPFLFGDKPSTIDATAFGMIGMLPYGGFPDCPLKSFVDQSRLAAYCARIKDRYLDLVPSAPKS